jgi:L-threonylcarbamoyladenylate synthase
MDLDGRIAAVVDGGACEVGVESTVVDVTKTPVRLLRPGGITVPMLEKVVGTVQVDNAVTHALEEGAVAASPGMKYKHYAPLAHVVLVQGTSAAYCAFVNEQARQYGDGLMAMCFDGEEATLTVPTISYGRREDAEAQAHRVFEALRRLDDNHAKLVYVACPEPDGVGLAVYNRLLRAAGFEVIRVD